MKLRNGPQTLDQIMGYEGDREQAPKAQAPGDI
jgi:hypothetical protein